MQRKTMQCHTVVARGGRRDGRLSESGDQVHTACGDEGLTSLNEVRGPVPCRCRSGSGASRGTSGLHGRCMECPGVCGRCCADVGALR